MIKPEWGPVTPEGTRSESNEFTYVYNHDLSSKEKIERTIRFILGRLLYYDTQLPPNPNHIIKLDLRGQRIPQSSVDYIRGELTKRYPSDLTINFIQN